MRLFQLLDGSVSSDFILIQDKKNVRAELLLNEFISHNVRLQNNTVLLSVVKNPALSENLPNAANFSHHQLRDSRAWLKDKSGLTINDDDDPSRILGNIQQKSKSTSKTVIIINSLTFLFLVYPDRCYKIIHHLVNSQPAGKHQQQVICLLHSDVIPRDKNIITMFEQLATTNLIVEQENKKSQVIIKHRKASGRVIHTVEQFFVDHNMSLVTKEIEKTEKTKADQENKTELINNDVTFKLQLEDDEKHARSQLVLPYLKNSNQPKTGEIIYEPDAADDWDEEDPDDDLNI